MNRFFAIFLLVWVGLPVGAGELVSVHHRSRWLSATGDVSKYLAADSRAWLAGREAFIRRQSGAFPGLSPALPVVYHLDAGFVEAARLRKSVRVVDDCGQRELCGVATTELNEEWDAADLRALFTTSSTQPIWREAFSAALAGRFEGEELDLLAADIVRAGLGADPRSPGDPRLSVPLLASLIRFVDPKHGAKVEEARLRVGALTAADMERWKTAIIRMLPARREASGVATPPLPGPFRLLPQKVPLRGATLSVVNRIESSTISNGSCEEIERLRARGFNAIVLVPFGLQRGFSGSEIQRLDNAPAGETDLAMRLPATRAHRLGMQVMLKPHIWPAGGAVDPTQIEPGDWSAWFASYERFLVHEALLARSMRADWLVIGTELNRTEHRPEWRRLIRIARALFHGRILYAANFDSFERTPFWQQLDAIGVDSYFPLSQRKDATDSDLQKGARAAVARLDAVAARTFKPVIVTELGYALSDAPWVTPWNGGEATAVAESDQARAFEAFLGALRGARFAGGFVVWKYESGPAPWREAFLVKGLKSEQIIQRYLR